MKPDTTPAAPRSRTEAAPARRATRPLTVSGRPLPISRRPLTVSRAAAPRTERGGAPRTERVASPAVAGAGRSAARAGLLALSALGFLATGAAARQDGLKVYISADMEGVVGVVTGDQLGPDGFEYQRFRELMTNEVIAAIEAAREAAPRRSWCRTRTETARTCSSSGSPPTSSSCARGRGR
jgi:hypothetical protein